MRACAWTIAGVVVALLACREDRHESPAPVQPPVEIRPAEAPTPPPERAQISPPQPLVIGAQAASGAPAFPTSLVARAVSPSEISLSWAPGVGGVAATEYELLRGGVAIARGPTASRADRSVRPAHTYCYSIVALDAAGNRSPPSAEACASTPDVVPPTMPGSVTASATSDRAVAISWNASSDDGGVAGYEVFRGEARVATTAALQASEARLRPGVRYCYAVAALDRAGNRSPRSAPACVTTPDLTPPSPPSDVVARGWGEHEIVVGWSAAEDDVAVAGYELLRDGKVIAKATETHASEHGLEPWREYCYQVRAFDAAGNMSTATKPACVRTHDLTPPTVPVAEATAVSDRELAIRWSPSTDNVGIAGYEVEWHDGSVMVKGRTELVRKDLLPAHRYCFWVRATDPAGNKSEPTQACATTPDLTPPTTPGSLAVAPRAPTQVVVVWDASQDDVGVVAYDILRGAEVVATVSRTWTTVTGLAAEKEHCFSVRARDAAGNRSNPAGPLCATTPAPSTPPGPVNLRVDTGVAGVRLRWEPSTQPGVVYAVYRDDDRRIGMTRAESYTLPGSAAGPRRCYRVAAVDGAGLESPKTLPACAPARVAATSP